MSLHKQKIRMGMVGGGQGAFIGAIHRHAANLDGQIELVCGAFSSSAINSAETGKSLSLDPARCYENFNEMFTKEAKLPAHQRMQFVSIVTPNHLHFEVAQAALIAGFHVLSDKPATFNLQETIALQDLLSTNNLLYGLTHTYTGYPLVKEAHQRIAQGELGDITKVVVEYSQGWLAASEDTSNKQASWRLDPNKAGISCCMGDIGVHAANLAESITGLEIVQLCAELDPVVEGRLLDDDGTVLLRFDNGAKGVLIASQISVGEENNLNIRVYGTKASIAWRQEEPNTLHIKSNANPTQVVRTGVGQLSDAATHATRTPAGHPEGYIEAFANIYQGFAEQVRAFDSNQIAKTVPSDTPGIRDAIRGMAFIENVVAASQSSSKWHTFELLPSRIGHPNETD